MTPHQDLLAIGRLAKAFGVQGHLVVQLLTDAPARFRNLRDVFLGPDAAAAVPTRIERAMIDGRGVRVKLAGVDDRTAAERLCGRFLFVDVEHQRRLPRGRYFVHDVIGLRVVDATRGEVGIVRDVLKYPAHDVYVVEHQGREYMIPAVKAFVRRIDITAGTMAVHLIDGMVDEQAAEEA